MQRNIAGVTSRGEHCGLYNRKGKGKVEGSCEIMVNNIRVVTKQGIIRLNKAKCF